MKSVLNKRINKLRLPHSLYSGAKYFPLFSHRLFHIWVCLIVLWHPFSCDDTNTISRLNKKLLKKIYVLLTTSSYSCVRDPVQVIIMKGAFLLWWAQVHQHLLSLKLQLKLILLGSLITTNWQQLTFLLVRVFYSCLKGVIIIDVTRVKDCLVNLIYFVILIFGLRLLS